MTFNAPSTAAITLSTAQPSTHVHAHQTLKQRAAAELAFSEFDFGNETEVTDANGWSYSTPGWEWTRKVYVETAPEDDGPAPRHVLNFTVHFSKEDGSFVEAVALTEDGSEWGSMPSISEDVEALGFSSMAEYCEHRAVLAASKELSLSQMQPCGSKNLQHVEAPVHVYEVGDDNTHWYAKVIPSGALFQVHVYDADGDRRPEHEKELESEKEARAWADKVVLRSHGKLPLQVPVDEKVSNIIAQAFHLFMSDRVIVSKAELINAIECHMTSTEKGKHFFEVRQTLNNMIALGTFVKFEASLPGGQSTLLIARNGVVLSQVAAVE